MLPTSRRASAFVILACAAVGSAGCRQTVVLDQGGDGGGGQGGGGFFDDGGGFGERFGSQWCDSLSPVPRAPDVMMVLDRSSVMQTAFGNGTRLEAARQQVLAMVQVYQSTVLFGYEEFPGTSPTCSGSGGPGCCAGDAFDPIPGAFALIQNAMRACDPGTNPPCGASPQRPVADALARARQVYSGPDMNGRNRYVVLITGDEPTCGPDSSPDSACTAARTQVAQLAQANIRTYVLAVGGPTSSDCLNNLAFAGGRPQSQPQGYYLARTPSDLEEELPFIVGEIARDACHMELSRAPSGDPDQLALFFNGKQINRDGVNGWELDNGSPFKITLHGAACDTFLGGLVEVELRSACVRH